PSSASAQNERRHLTLTGRGAKLKRLSPIFLIFHLPAVSVHLPHRSAKGGPNAFSSRAAFPAPQFTLAVLPANSYLPGLTNLRESAGQRPRCDRDRGQSCYFRQDILPSGRRAEGNIQVKLESFGAGEISTIADSSGSFT